MGWGGFTTRDLKRCQHMARLIALIYNWWSLFVLLADPDHHREAITSRPLLLHGIARRIQHAGQTRLTVTSSHGCRRVVVAALRRITGFFRSLMQSAEQLSTEGGSLAPHPGGSAEEVPAWPPAGPSALAAAASTRARGLKSTQNIGRPQPATAGFGIMPNGARPSPDSHDCATCAPRSLALVTQNLAPRRTSASLVVS